MKKIVLASALVLAATTSGAFAYDRGGWNAGDRIDARQHRQEMQIQQGLRSGELTRREAAELQAEQARIRSLERQALRDGHIDRREAAKIADAQRDAARHIAQERRDEERRGNRYGWWNRRWW